MRASICAGSSGKDDWHGQIKLDVPLDAYRSSRRATMTFEITLQTHLGEAERRLKEAGGRNVREEMEEISVSRESKECDEEEAQRRRRA
ncbi:unnamed protein product [Litomosoides sigmodontis]|uniref:Uncharacterized protein n=1 Tax=Litomosoides sigmodontis TaxID=42156 RepID=A0A3P6SIH0_LITSI|nr:unnamed protein product [Litomosoides sigmodontis]